MKCPTAAKLDFVVRNGIRENASAEGTSMAASSKPTSMESLHWNNVTFVEKAVACGLSRSDAEKLERLSLYIDRSCEDSMSFLVSVAEKLIERHRPKYTYEEIVEMHRHLG